MLTKKIFNLLFSYNYLKFTLKLKSMKMVWEVGAYSQIEATVIMELITAKTEMDGDYSG